MKVNLYKNQVDDTLLQYAVIVSKYKGQWVFCRHKDRISYEIPGGHREPGECIIDTAKRELKEETGALKFDLDYLCDYSVEDDQRISYGRVFVSKINELGDLPESEMDEVLVTSELPDLWTYPDIQKKFIEYIMKK